MMCDVKAQQEGRRRLRMGLSVVYASASQRREATLSLLLDRICRAFE